MADADANSDANSDPHSDSGQPTPGQPEPGRPQRPRPVRRRRIRDRVPVRLRHHWKPAGALCAGLTLVVVFLGDVRVSPYVTSASRAEADVITENVEGTVDLYDTSVAHSITLSYDQTDFDAMMKEFRKDGTKEFIEADLIIDGVHLADVGIRLKGNSTLASLNPGGRSGPPGGGGERVQEVPWKPSDAEQRDGGQRDGGQRDGGQPDAGHHGDGPQDDGQRRKERNNGPGPGPGGSITAYELSPDKPEELPWLIKIDQYLEGRAYQGEREISLRPGSNGQVPLNEALSLSLTDAGGEPAEAYAFSRVTVNDRPTATRLMVENPDTEYAEGLDGDGVLYKARADGRFAYRGNDPSEYQDSFRQLNKVGSQDLEPVMNLIRWVERASDEEFAEELDEHVDVASLARYVAAQNLLLNYDDMAGPGSNYLLWYDLDDQRFSVLGWDYNLSFFGDPEAGPNDAAGPRPGHVVAPGKQAPDADQPPSGTSKSPERVPEPAEGMPEPPDDADGKVVYRMGGHPLKERFLEVDAFEEVYQEAYRELYREFYGSGTALDALTQIADQAREAGADSAELDTAEATLRKTVTERRDALARDATVRG